MDNEQNKRDMLDVGAPEANEPPKGTYFLDKFLKEPEPVAEEPASAPTEITPPAAPDAPPASVRDGVIAVLQGIYDPEIPVNIYELGLIYEVDVAEDGATKVVMTLTTPHCPVAETMPGEVEMRVGSVEGVTSVDLDLVWDPPWDMSKMSDEARLELGLL